MNKPDCFIGIDMSAETFDAAIYRDKIPVISSKEPFENNLNGFKVFCDWLQSNKVSKDNSAICMEITGVYSEVICYYLHDQGYVVWAEAPHKVHRAFHMQNKNDKTSAIQIAEYIYRFFDQIQPFKPNEAIIEQIKTLLTTREQLVSQSTANKNILHSVKRKHYQTPLANELLKETIEHLEKSVKIIDKELRNLINNNSKFAPIATALSSIPGIKMLFIANFLVVTNGLTEYLNYKNLASYIGICPNEFKSGTSVYRKPRSSGYGPPRLRKLLYLASMSVKNNRKKFADYFILKQNQGKANGLILNNIANKLLRIICAISKNESCYIVNYKSVHPKFLKQGA